MKPPKKWKMAIIIWIAIYPTITLLFLFFGKYFNTINPLPIRTFVITVIVVPLMVFAIMPFLQKLMAEWLKK
jgi:hypothetical protein